MAAQLRHHSSDQSQAGFSLTEALIATSILLLLFSAATNGLNQTVTFSRTTTNRAEMHGSVRGATELLQQEIGQAGRVTLPGPIALAGAVVKARRRLSRSRRPRACSRAQTWSSAPACLARR